MIEKTKVKVLYIDDEPHNLAAFRASFRDAYTIYTTTSTQEARQLLAEEPDIAVVFCDQRMPGETGSAFFAQLLRAFPKPIRILITAYADLDAVIKAINNGHIFRYVSKPWSDLEIHSAIDEAYRFYQTTALLARSNEALNRAYEELDKFAYSATHDIRGPIVSSLGLLKIANESDSLEEVRRMMGMMESSMKKVDEYIRGLHEYYNLRRGELEIVPIDFKALVADQLSFFSLDLEKQGIEVSTEIDQKERFRNDLVSLRVILNNLLSNAIKYQRQDAENKQIGIRIKVEKGKAWMEVSDNGMGIADEDQALVYNLFFRQGNHHQGSGFGLYHAREAVGRIHGHLSLQSRLNEGSRFLVEIPGK